MARLADRSVGDSAARFHTLYRGQERRKRVLGWRRTHKDPFEGSVTDHLLVACQSRTEQRRHFPRITTPFPRTLSALAYPYPPARDAENTSPPAGNLGGAMAS